MTARAGGQVSAPGQQPHGPVVDLLISGHGPPGGLATFGEGRGVQDDEVILPLLQLGQQVEHVGGHAVHHLGQAVAGRVFPGTFHGELRHVHGGDAGRAAPGGVQGEGAGVGEAVQHRFAPGQPGHRLAVVLLVQEEAGFLAVFKVHGIADAVFHDVRAGEVRQRLSGQGIPALALGHALLVPQGSVVALIYPGDVLAVLPQDPDQLGEDHVLHPVQPQAQHLGHQHRAEPVHRQAREMVRLAENHPAAGQLLRGHDGLAVVPGVFHPPGPEVRIEPVIGVAGQQPHPDQGAAVVESGAQPAAPAAYHVHQVAVGGAAGNGGDLPLIDPGVAAGQGRLPLGGDGDLGIGSFSFHNGHRPFVVWNHCQLVKKVFFDKLRAVFQNFLSSEKPVIANERHP